LSKQPLIESLKLTSFYKGGSKLKYYYYDFYSILRQQKNDPHFGKLVRTMYIILKTDIEYFNPKNIAYLVSCWSSSNLLYNMFWNFINFPQPNVFKKDLDIEYIYQEEIVKKMAILKYFINYRIDVGNDYISWKPILKEIKKEGESYPTSINDQFINCWKCKKKGLLVTILDKKYNCCRICYCPDLTDQQKQDKWSRIEAHENRLRLSGWTEQEIYNARC
jgi:hypothetical protein